MKSSKHSEHKAAQPPRNPARDFHIAKEKEVPNAPEPKAHHKDSKRDK